LKVRLRPSLILWLSVLVYLNSEVVLPFFLAAALHESGHLLVLRLLRKPAREMVLGFSGAVLETPPLGYREEFLAAAAGPLASLLLGLITPLWPLLGLWSLALGCFNLLPIPGLDGGRMLRCLALLHLSPEGAGRLTRFAALLTALGIWGTAVYCSLPGGCGLWPLLLAAGLVYRALSMDSGSS